MAVIITYSLFFISGLVYFGYVCYFLKGLDLLPEEQSFLADREELPRLTIIIPARNEEANIGTTLDSLLSQNYPSSAYDIIAINDRSTDETGSILDRYSNDYERIKVIHIKEKPEGVSPKKHALMQAVALADTEYVITTDADCQYHKNWLKNYAASTRSKPAVVAGLTVFHKEKYTSAWEHIWQKMQYIDYVSHSLLAAGAIGNGKGFTANGSNMMFQKALYLEGAEQKLKSKVTSGDDFFLIQAAAAEGKPLKFLTDRESLVKSLPVDTLKELFNQRARWASKTGSASRFVLLFGLNTFFFYTGILAFIILCAVGIASWWQLVILVFLKVFPETILLSYGHGKFGLKFRPLSFLLLQLFHIPYNLAAGIKGTISGFTWKGETYKS